MSNVVKIPKTVTPPIGICADCVDLIETNEQQTISRVYCPHHRAGALMTIFPPDTAKLWKILTPVSREEFYAGVNQASDNLDELIRSLEPENQH